MPFQPGNQLGKRQGIKRQWELGIERALKARGITRLEALGRLWDKIYDQAMDGNLMAANMILDRELGKPAQNVNIGGQEDNPLVLEPCESLTAHIRAITATRDLIERVGQD